LPMPTQVLWILERARVHHRLGNADQALRDYRYVAAIWRHADSVLQPYVEEARTAAAQLAGAVR